MENVIKKNVLKIVIVHQMNFASMDLVLVNVLLMNSVRLKIPIISVTINHVGKSNVIFIMNVQIKDLTITVTQIIFVKIVIRQIVQLIVMNLTKNALHFSFIVNKKIKYVISVWMIVIVNQIKIVEI